MTVENGADQAANDTTVTDNTQAAQNTQPEAGENTDVDGSEGAAASDDEEIDVDGEKYVISRKVREALAKPFQQDYSRKTEEVAQGRKALDGEREAFGKTREAQQAHIQDYAKVVALGDRIAELEGDQGIGRYKNVDWLALSQQDQASYQQHRAIYDTLKDQREQLTRQRDAAARAWTEKEQEYASNANRTHGERVAKATAEIAKLVEGWTPGGELDIKLGKYGNSLGFSNGDMADLAIRNPKFVFQLNRLRISDEAAAKQKTQQTFEESQKAQPLTRVGGNGSGTQRRTTDASGDALSTEEWVKRERERLRKRA